MIKARHSGHRQRMRDKLKNYGERVFESYELLEMLLYSTIPVKDTKSLAKELLYRFGDVEGVLSATVAELCETEGVGIKTAELIKTVEALPKMLYEGRDDEDDVCRDYGYFGRLLTDYFSDKQGSSVVMISLDSRLRVISTDEIYGLDYASAGVRPEGFIKMALMRNAVCVIISHNHPHGPLFPTEGDISANALINDALSRLGIAVAEHYIVCGERYFGFVNHFETAFKQPPPYLSSFIESKHCAMSGKGEQSLSSNKEAEQYLRSLLEFSDKNSISAADGLILSFGSLSRVLESDFLILSQIVGERTAALIRCAVALSRVRVTDKYRVGRKYTVENYEALLRATLFCEAQEMLYMLSLDKSDRLIGINSLARGTVSQASITPRALVEVAMRLGAKSVILAHNHPSGYAKASETDIFSTATVSATFKTSGIQLLGHYIVAADEIVDILPQTRGHEE